MKLSYIISFLNYIYFLMNHIFLYKWSAFKKNLNSSKNIFSNTTLCPRNTQNAISELL